MVGLQGLSLNLGGLKICTMNRLSQYFLSIAICLALAACGAQEKDPNLLSEVEMVPILADMQIAYAGVDNTVRNPKLRATKYEEMNQLVLKKHNMDRDKFYSSYEYYQSQPVLMDTIYQQIIVALNAEMSKVQAERRNSTPKPKAQYQPPMPGMKGKGIKK